MITARIGGQGIYTYREAYHGHQSVLVAKMPDDFMQLRIVFRTHGETDSIHKMSECEGELLWSALKAIAIDLNWDDRLASEIKSKENV